MKTGEFAHQRTLVAGTRRNLLVSAVMEHPPKLRMAAVKVISLVLAIAFVLTGGATLWNSLRLVANLGEWNYRAWLLLSVAVIEISGAIILLLPPRSWLGIIVLSTMTFGNILRHLIYSQPSKAVLPSVLLFLLAIVGYARRLEWLSLVRGTQEPGHSPEH